MRTTEQAVRKVISTKEVYVGIDMHKESWHVTIRSDGEERFNGRIPGQYQSLKRVLERYRDLRINVAYEAGPFGFWLLDRLVLDGIGTIVVPPPSSRLNQAIRSKPTRETAASWLHCWKRICSNGCEHRDLLRTRRQIVDHHNNVARQIKSKLLFYGISSPFTATTRWSVQYVEWLKTLTFETAYLKEAFDLLIELYEYLTRQIARISRTVVLLCRDKKYRQKIELLYTAPGIGKLTAIELLVELQDITRFKSAEELASYIGLTPAEYSTGERTRQGRITRCGNKRVRTYLVESTWG